MKTISLCMIVKNEEKVLERCLSSICSIVDEIIIVDTGSTDHTKEIAKKFTTNIYDFAWIDDFSAARNYSFSKATKDFILWLDADDVLLEIDQKKLTNLKQQLTNRIDAIYFLYDCGIDDFGNVSLSFYRERLLRREKNFKWHDPVHEYIKVNGATIIEDIHVTHKPLPKKNGRNLIIYENLIKKGIPFSPRSTFYYAKELYENQKDEKAIPQFLTFLECKDGYIEDKIQACFILSFCYANTNQKDKILDILIKSFQYDTPRAEICFRIGLYFEECDDISSALYWFHLTTKLEKPKTTLGFLLHEYWGYLPHIQLCVCYDILGNYEEAIKHNTIADFYKPGDSFVKDNYEYLKTCIMNS